MLNADTVEVRASRRWARATLAALSVYYLWGAFLIAQKPGLEDDEALLVAGAIHMRHPGADFPLARPDHAWICPLQHCIPLMSADYIGAVKEYLSLPLFYVLGPGATSIRLVSLFLGGVGLWGIGKLIAEQAGPLAGTAVTLTLALNPAYLTMVVFDNAGIASMMAGLGLMCAALAVYVRRRTIAWAFLFGAAIGFSVWARANLLWTILAGGIAAAAIYRRRLLVPLREIAAIGAGGILGGSPFLLFQIVSGGTTWKDQFVFAAHEPWRELLRYRLFLFSDVLLADGEHRRMWNAVLSAPDWQLWLFPILVVVSCLVCLLAQRAEKRGSPPFAQTAALAFVFLTAELLFSRMALAEHHFIALLPLAAVVVVLACNTLTARHRSFRFLTAGVALLYGAAALSANVVAIRGLRASGGIGDWSDGAQSLAKHLDSEPSAGRLKILDWGFEDNLYVLTDARLNTRELFWNASEQQNDRQQPWTEEIREGGRFLVPGPENRHFMGVLSGFEKALREVRPVTHRYRALQRDASTYAQIIEIEPNSGRGPLPGGADLPNEIPMGDSRFDVQLSGFYPLTTRRGLIYQIDQDGWRETQRSFSVNIGVLEQAGKGYGLFVRLYITNETIPKRGSLTLRARVGDQSLAPETYGQPGLYTYRRAIPADWITQTSIRVEFAVDNPGAVSSENKSGILVRAISLEPE